MANFDNFGSDLLTAFGGQLSPDMARMFEARRIAEMAKADKAQQRQTVQDQLGALIGTAPTPFQSEQPLRPGEQPQTLQMPGTGFGANMTQDQVSNLQNLGALSPETVLKGLSGQMFAGTGAVKPKQVQSSDIDENGLVKLVYTDGSIETKPPEKADQDLIDESNIKAAILQGKRSGERTMLNSSIKMANDAYKKIGSIRQSVRQLNEGIRLIDEGAETGAIAHLLPSVRRASIELDNLQQRMGLNVIQNTTFGSLSSTELKFAMDQQLPKKLEGPALKAWLVRKRNAQNKLMSYYSKAADYLGSTDSRGVKGFLELQREQAKASNPQSPQQTLEGIANPQAQQSPQEGQTIRQGNKTYRIVNGQPVEVQ